MDRLTKVNVLDMIYELIANNSNIEAENDDVKAFDDIEKLSNGSDGVKMVFANGQVVKITCEIE